MDEDKAEKIGQLLDTPNLAGALESDRFKQFLDHVPVAIAVSELEPSEAIVYANIEFEQLTGAAASEIYGRPWSTVPGMRAGAGGSETLGTAITGGEDHVGRFAINRADGSISADAWSNLIEDDDGKAVFRLVALVAKEQESAAAPDRDKLVSDKLASDKELLLRELQHRVKNNLQMITALIRLESRTLSDANAGQRFDRLAGRVEALALLYQSLSDEEAHDTVDLGIYLSQIASAVMRAHAQEGIHLNLQVDTWPVSINVAMPTGLVVNELMTNALKHAFVGRDGGTITLKSLVEGDGCCVVLADDGIGLEPGTTWPSGGKLSALIVESLRTNAKARVVVESAPGQGMQATIFFARADAAPPDQS